MIPLANPDITKVERRHVLQALWSNTISGTGPQIREFEAAWEQRSGRKRAFAVSNGTVALEIALQAIGIGPGDEVIVPALTFAAPAAAVRRLGATPVFADVGVDAVINVLSVAERITEKTRAIIAVDTLGNIPDYNALMDLAFYYGLTVIEDAAEAHGSSRLGKLSGTFGHISTFSFHANKTITTGEGGMILLDDDDTIGVIELIRNHGMRKPYIHEVVGTNGRMTSLTAALGIGQMQRWDEIMQRRKEIDRAYDAVLPSVYYSLPISPNTSRIVWLKTICVRDEHHDGLRDRIVHRLREAQIDARAIWPPLTGLKPYQSEPLPVAEIVSGNSFWLPTYNTLGDDDIYRIGEELRIAYEREN